MSNYETFVAEYDGDDCQTAHDAYEDYRFGAEALLEVAYELDPHDAELARAKAARELVCAETIGYRFQACQRRRIYNGAIFIEDVDHYEYNLTPGGSVSYRRDWMDREEVLVRAFVADKYPYIVDYIEGIEL